MPLPAPPKLNPAQVKQKYIQLPVSLKYALLLSLVAGFLSLITLIVMAWFIQRNYTLFMGEELGVSSQVIQLVRREQNILETTLFVLFLMSVTTMFAVSWYVTRRLSQPLVAIERHLLLLSKGDRRPFRMGKNKDFRDLEQLVNRALT